jgi:hypothetical protein
MSGLREQVAFAISHGNMTQNVREETCADLIGALAMANPLGAALWRVTGNLDASALRRAKRLLAERIMLFCTFDEPLIWKMATMALQEWLACLCPDCNGKAQKPNQRGVREVCKTCNGTGRGRYSDAARTRALGVDYDTYIECHEVLKRAHEELTTADRNVTIEIYQQLERKVPKVKEKKAKPAVVV